METIQQVENPYKLENWQGLGGWNYYFILKFALLWFGYLNFHPFQNLVFLAFLLFPIPVYLHQARTIFALPIGIALFYHDSWLPNIINATVKGNNYLNFPYIIELTKQLIDWNMISAGFIILLIYLFLSRWIRITVFTVVTLCWLSLIAFQTTDGPLLATNIMAARQSTPHKIAPLPPTNTQLNSYLSEFYSHEKQLNTLFPNTLAANSEAFDILILQISALSWSDLKQVNLEAHPLWEKFDVLFNNFNSATSYSAPAGIRLFRASCGQTSQKDLYALAKKECYLINHLSSLGFIPELMLDHNGVNGNFLDLLNHYGTSEKIPLMSEHGITQTMTKLDGSPVFDDTELLNKWLKQKQERGSGRSVTYFNIVSLQNGNRAISSNKEIPYKIRAKTLLDELVNFLSILDKSGRKVLVIFIPESGANLSGDSLQLPGFTNIPSPAITHVPVGIKMTGMNSPLPNKTISINNSSSYLAISQILSQLLDGHFFTQADASLQQLIKKLPQTPVVSENEGVKVIKYQGIPYVLLQGDASWIPYPKSN